MNDFSRQSPVIRLTAFLKEIPGHTLKRGRDGMGGSRGHIYLPKTDKICSLQFRTRHLSSWCSDNALDVCSGDAQFESRPGHELSWEVSRGFSQSFKANSERVFWLGHNSRFLANPFKFTIQQLSHNSVLYSLNTEWIVKQIPIRVSFASVLADENVQRNTVSLTGCFRTSSALWDSVSLWNNDLNAKSGTFLQFLINWRTPGQDTKSGTYGLLSYNEIRSWSVWKIQWTSPWK
jgi:hypothetical protein